MSRYRIGITVKTVTIGSHTYSVDADDYCAALGAFIRYNEFTNRWVISR